jgi:uncharacterized protein YcbK (DUF882 family)
VTAANAPAQPTPRGKHETTAAAPRPKSSDAANGTARIAANAYLAGKQPLVGWHAPSTKPVAQDDGGRPMLTLTTLNRGETLAMCARSDDGGFATPDLDRVAHLLRAATGDEHPIDPRALSLVYRIATHFSVPEIRVVSGYRVPRPGSRSNHGKGRAMDLVVPGVPDEEVARFVRDIGFVGVGVYPTSQFVHVDVRPRSYFWVDVSGPHMKNRERSILADLASESDAAALARGQAPIEPFGLLTDVDAALRARGVAPTTTAPDEDEDEE